MQVLCVNGLHIVLCPRNAYMDLIQYLPVAD
jgi:hypothetical protein